MFPKILTFITVALVALAVVIYMQPEEFKVTRSATMNATSQVVFDQVNNYRKWDAWSPWSKLDPNSKVTFTGPESGVGATFAWVGNSNVGEGRQTIVESRSPELIRIKLEFFKPMEGVNDTEFTFKPEGEGTLVTWTMSGKNNFIGKAMSLVMDCDKMVGGYFEQGLTNMKGVVESAPKKPASSAP